MSRQICHAHCPPESGGILVAAGLGALVLALAAVVAFIAGHLALVLSGAVAIVAAEVALLRLLRRFTVLAWSHQEPARARVALAVGQTVNGRLIPYTKPATAIPAVPGRPAIEAPRPADSRKSLRLITLGSEPQAAPERGIRGDCDRG
ncbi:MAG TPA: hypothetical protein VMF87_08025 [Streptosporangiaceae bacterium]|nr:hypothetical protein [Streptosporangiaceae bacterium]